MILARDRQESKAKRAPPSPHPDRCTEKRDPLWLSTWRLELADMRPTKTEWRHILKHAEMIKELVTDMPANCTFKAITLATCFVAAAFLQRFVSDFFCDQKFWMLSMKMLFMNYCWAHSVRDTFRRRHSDRVSFETVTSVDSYWCEYLTHTRTCIHV